MKKRASESGPFQLFIGIIVFGMALAIGAYLFDMVNCWKCNELLKAQVTNLREAISSVGKGDTNSRDSMLVQLEDLGSCAKGIYIRHVSEDEGLQCESFCPQHPNSCWVVIPESSCGGEELDFECADISGDTEITANETILGTMATSDNQWYVGAYSISHTVSLTIEKTGPSQIYIGKPGGRE